MDARDSSGEAISAHYRAMPITWEMSFDGEGFTPYKAIVGGKTLRIRMNPPGPAAYTLLVDGREIADFSEWPAGWMQPWVANEGKESAPNSEPSIEPRVLREWSEQLCRIASAEPEEMAAALGLTGSLVKDFDDLAVEPHPPGTRRIRLIKHTLGFSYVEISVAGNSLTRARLDAHFGESQELPRVHYDSPRTIAYGVEVIGAPFKCSVFAYFTQEPAASAAATRVMLRRDPA